MRKSYIKMAVTAIVALTVGGSAYAQIPDGYYASLKGKKGAELKSAVHEIIKDAKVLSYGSGKGATWEGFYSTDRLENNQVVDRYSNDVRYFTSEGAKIGGMNIEHSFPKSWWGGASTQAYKDLYNLMPSEEKINSSKSNYPMGEVTNASTDNGCTKVGSGTNGYKLWEPDDKWKGDFARDYMYMATAYQNYTWSGAQALQILQQGDYPTLQKWAYTLYIRWAKADVVDKLEITRNDAVSKIQGNRNPYIDFPNLMEYVWGDSIDYAFDPETTMKSSDYNGGGGTVTPDPEEKTVYTATFTSTDGNCTIENKTVPSDGFIVWTPKTKYGWTGTAYSNSTNHAAESSLVTPEIDLSGYSDATLSFNHAVNFCKSPADVLAVEVRCDGQTTTLSGIEWPKGSTWTFNESGDISLKDFAGKSIKIAFHYNSTNDEASTWEIKSMTVKATKITTGISTVTTTNGQLDMSKPYKAYTIDGQETDLQSARGIVIIQQDGKSWKIAK